MLDHPAETRGERDRRDSADPTSLTQTNRAALAGLQAYRRPPNIETLETPIQAFHRKLPPQKTEATQTIQDAK